MVNNIVNYDFNKRGVYLYTLNSKFMVNNNNKQAKTFSNYIKSVGKTIFTSFFVIVLLIASESTLSYYIEWDGPESVSGGSNAADFKKWGTENDANFTFGTMSQPIPCYNSSFDPSTITGCALLTECENGKLFRPRFFTVNIDSPPFDPAWCDGIVPLPG